MQFLGDGHEAPQLSDQLDQFLADIEKATRATGALRSFAAQPHIRVPGEESIPAFIATVVVQLGLADREAFATLLADPAASEVYDTWRGRRSFNVAWVNHQALA